NAERGRPGDGEAEHHVVVDAQHVGAQAFVHGDRAGLAGRLPEGRGGHISLVVRHRRSPCCRTVHSVRIKKPRVERTNTRPVSSTLYHAAGSPCDMRVASAAMSQLCVTVCRKAYRFLSTVAGLWPSAANVPSSPNTTVPINAPNAAAAAGPGSQTNVRFITRVTTYHAAIEPAATPNSAVTDPSRRYSSA